MATLADPLKRIEQLEAELARANDRIAALTDAMNRQAAKVIAANQARRTLELHAAGVLLEASPDFDPTKKVKHGANRAISHEVSGATRSALNPDTKLVVHQHTESCTCDETDGHRLTVELKEY